MILAAPGTGFSSLHSFTDLIVVYLCVGWHGLVSHYRKQLSLSLTLAIACNPLFSIASVFIFGDI